jgi:hypothetical protein
VKSNWPIIVLFIVLLVFAGMALRWNSLGGSGEPRLIQPVRWTTPSLSTSTAQPTESTGWWNQMPTKKPVGKSTSIRIPTKTLKP